MSEIVIFFRGDMFYPMELLDPSECGRTLEAQAAEHAELNPGTKRVEDVSGNVLWRPQ